MNSVQTKDVSVAIMGSGIILIQPTHWKCLGGRDTLRASVAADGYKIVKAQVSVIKI